MKNKITTNLVLAIAVGFLATGCSTTLQHGKIFTTPLADKGPMGVASHAERMKDRIGWGTITVFAIPIAPVTVNGDPGTELMNQIKDAVAQAGYQVKMVDSAGSAGSMPVLSCKVQKFGFRNYTWLFPIVFNWGTIQLDVTITAPDGRLLWKKTYVGKGNGMYDFNPTVNNALTAILNELSNDLLNADLKSVVSPLLTEKYEELQSSNPDEVVHALKVLRGMNDPGAVPYILPLLQSSKVRGVLRDSCRTLAVIGNKDVIPAIKPLLDNPDAKVRKDAQDAIDKLNAK